MLDWYFWAAGMIPTFLLFVAMNVVAAKRGKFAWYREGIVSALIFLLLAWMVLLATARSH